ncbi:MAG: SGNH/GDSL hydrolase family protein [Clostridia bacterium]|nr:SGNH/GDSL hydrolase family protein [Clostridia bacterium]
MHKKILCMTIAFAILLSAMVSAEGTTATATELLMQYPAEGITSETSDYFFMLKDAVLRAEKDGTPLNGIPNYDKFQSVRWQLCKVLSAEVTAMNESAAVVVTLDTKIPAEQINTDTVSILRGNQEVNYTLQKGTDTIDVFRILIPNQMWEKENLRLRIQFGMLNYTKLFSIKNDISYNTLTLTTSDGKVIESPEQLQNGELNVSYQITNHTHQDGISNFTVYTAVYDQNGSFIRLKKEAVDMLGYEQSKQISFSFVNLPERTKRISSFMWQNNNLKPLVEKKELKKTYGYDNVMDPSKDLHISFIGGSITQGGHYSNPLLALLQQDRTGTITSNNAGVGGTGSNYGTIRFYDEVLVHHPDIVFVEFTLNDQTKVNRLTMQQNVESMIRESYAQQHVPVIIFIHIPDRRYNERLQNYGITSNIEKYDQVLNHYGLFALNSHQLVLDSISKHPQDSWDNYVKSNNVHPDAQQGKNIANLMYQELKNNPTKYYQKIILPPEKYIAETPDVFHATAISPLYTNFDENWMINPEIRNVVAEGYGTPIQNPYQQYIASSKSGATLQFQFTGTRILLCGLTGGQGRECTYTITDMEGNIERQGTCHNYLANYKWYENNSLVEFGLSDTQHLLTLTVSEDAEADAAGKMFGIGEIWVDEK